MSRLVRAEDLGPEELAEWEQRRAVAGAREVRQAALLRVLALVLEAKLHGQLGDSGRADEAVEAAAELLLELLP